MSTIEDYAVPNVVEIDQVNTGPKGLKAFLGSATIGAMVMPLSFIQVTPPELSSLYVEKVLPTEAALGLGLGVAVGAAVSLANILKNKNSIK